MEGTGFIVIVATVNITIQREEGGGRERGKEGGKEGGGRREGERKGGREGGRR